MIPVKCQQVYNTYYGLEIPNSNMVIHNIIFFIIGIRRSRKIMDLRLRC